MGANLSSKGGRGRGYRTNQFSEINVTPFVDVMLVLLIIFMVTAPMMTSGVTVDLPDSAAAPIKGNDEPLTISIKSSGDVYIQESLTKLEDLAPKLEAILGEKKDSRIFIRGDKNVDYGTVMKVVGEVNAGGFFKVALISEQGESASKRKK
jgi:biopolymer transport protein TolR